MRSLGILGAGRMGYAVASVLIRRRMIAPRRLTIADPATAARRRAARLGCRVTPSALDAASRSESILLAVKPQKIQEVAALIAPAVCGKRVLSILAGTTRARLTMLFPGARIIRAMPNTPLMAGLGAIVIARDGLSAADSRFASGLFAPMGRVWVAPEKWMNAVTALSGSGPALICAFLEACVSAAAANGLPEKLSEELGIQTLAGTAHLLQNARLTPRALREMVTSPGGTTEAALQVFGRRRLERMVHEAIRAAVRRARILSR